MFIPLTVIFLNLVFPKGGVALGDVPITWANIVAVLGAISSVIAAPLCFQRFWAWLLASRCFLLYAYFFAWFVIFSIQDFDLFTNGFIFLGGLLVFPMLACITVYSIKQNYIDRMCRAYCAFTVILVLISFVLYFFPDLHIAGVTANTRDVDRLFTEKNNTGRGLLNLFKMIGTYQNGNIFGANLLIQLGMIYHFRDSNLVDRRFTSFAAGLLWLAVPFTLSRTVTFAAGAFLATMIVRKFRFTVRRIIGTGIGAGIVLVGAAYLLERFGLDEMFLHFDSTLGGRLLPEVVQRLREHWIFGEYNGFVLYDVVYVGFITSGGILMGTALALLWLLSYRFLLKIGVSAMNPMAAFVLVFGFIVVFFDSTYFWPPTAFNFWVAYFLCVRTAALRNVATDIRQTQLCAVPS